MLPAGLVPPKPDDATLDRVLAWSTMPIDRHRLRDRLRELRLWPWSGLAGDGARFAEVGEERCKVFGEGHGVRRTWGGT